MRPHPFAASAGVLAGVQAGKPDTATLSLPSLRTAPLDSPELIRVKPRPPARTAPALLNWAVPIVALDPASALAALGPRDEVRGGVSLGYLGRVAALARELAARGRVVPAIERVGRGGAACWRPVLTGQDAVVVRNLIVAMPPVSRAVPGHDDPDELTRGALAALVDAAVREALPAGGQLAPPRRGRRPRALPAVEAWLGALTGPEARFEADSRELDALVRALDPWEESHAVGSGPGRALFRLTEPPGPDGTGGFAPAGVAGDGADWQLEFLLQATDDPSFLVPAIQAWDDDGSLARWLPHPQELLLGELGRASRVYPDLGPGLRRARPTALALDAGGVHHFLTVAAAALDDAGFGVQVPSWWDSRRKLGLTVSATTPVDGVVDRPSRFGRDQLVEFRWQLALGDDSLTEEEVAALAAAKAPLVRLRGQWVAVDPEQLRRGLAFVEREPSGTMTAADLLALAATHPDDLGSPLPVTNVCADGWLGDLLAGSPLSLEPVPVPKGFRAELRPYQQRGLAWLALLASLGRGACLADDMGLGKTVQLLALEAVQRADNPDARPTLLLCPMSLVGNWQREAARFAPSLRVYAHHGPERHRGAKLGREIGRSDLVVSTYATATRDMDDLAGHQWGRVVLDEAQAIKNALSQTAKAVGRLQADHRVALTGTPVENRLAELWSIMQFLNPGLLGSSEMFRARYSVPVERHGITEPAERLRAITRPYVLRRMKTDPTIIDDLPEKIEIKQYCQLTTEQVSLYQSVVDDMMDRIEHSDGMQRRGTVLAAMTKLKQVCNHPAQLLHDRSPVGRRSGKVMRLEEILEEILAVGDRVLCFTQFTEMAELLVPHLAARFGTDVAYLHGGTPKARRDEMVARFQAGDDAPIFLLSLKAGGTGLNLTSANHVIHLDRWWNPAVENQATDRAFRIGQTRTVEVHKFVCTGTLEERIDDLIEEKRALADLVVADGEGWLTELSTADLRSIFALSEGAIDE